MAMVNLNDQILICPLPLFFLKKIQVTFFFGEKKSKFAIRIKNCLNLKFSFSHSEKFDLG